MKKIVEEILKGYNRKIYRRKIYVDIKTAEENSANLIESTEIQENPVLIIDGRTEKTIEEFFTSVYDGFSNFFVDFASCDDKSFTVRRDSYGDYVEDIYVFSKKALADKRVQTAFDKFVARTKSRFPYAEEDEKEIIYAQALARAAYGKGNVFFKGIEDIPGYQEFYQKNKDIVAKRLIQMQRDDKWEYVSDLLIRTMVLIAINLMFFLNFHGFALIGIDVILAGVIDCVDRAIRKEVIKDKLDNSVEKDLAHERDNILWVGLNTAGNKDIHEPMYSNNNDGKEICIRNRVLKAIRADIKIIDQMRYPGYQEDLNSLYELVGMFFQAIAGEKATSEELEGIKEILARLIDIERTLTMRLNYNGKLNAEMLLQEVEPSYEVKALEDTDMQEVMFDMEDRSKKLEF